MPRRGTPMEEPKDSDPEKGLSSIRRLIQEKFHNRKSSNSVRHEINIAVKDLKTLKREMNQEQKEQKQYDNKLLETRGIQMEFAGARGTTLLDSNNPYTLKKPTDDHAMNAEPAVMRNYFGQMKNRLDDFFNRNVNMINSYFERM